MNNNNGKGFVNSFFSALMPQRLTLKLLWIFVVITIFSVKEFIMNLNLWGSGQISIFTAVLKSYWNGTRIIYSSIYDFVTTYLLNKGVEIPIGDLVFGILFGIAGLIICFQVASIIIDILDMNVGDIGSGVLKLLLGIVFVMVLAIIAHYTGTESYIAQNLVEVTNTTLINQTLTNQTMQNATATISLI